jgi:hypothetical protein
MELNEIAFNFGFQVYTGWTGKLNTTAIACRDSVAGLDAEVQVK